MKKFDLSLNYDDIRIRLEDAMSGYKPAQWAKYIGVSVNIIANIHGKVKQPPSLQYIIAVARKTGRPVEWYLYGEESDAMSNCSIGCDEDLMDLCRKVKAIIESKTHWADSLRSNIKSFKKGLDNDKKMEILDQRLKNVEAVTSKGHSTGTSKTPARRTGSKKKAGSSM